MVWGIYLALVFGFRSKEGEKKLKIANANSQSNDSKWTSKQQKAKYLHLHTLIFTAHTHCGSKSKCNALSFWLIFFYFAFFIVHFKCIPLFEPNSMHQYSVTRTNGIQMSFVSFHNITILDVNIWFKFYIKHFSIRCFLCFIFVLFQVSSHPFLHFIHSPASVVAIFFYIQNFAQFCFISYQFGCFSSHVVVFLFLLLLLLLLCGPSSFFIFRHFLIRCFVMR